MYYNNYKIYHKKRGEQLMTKNVSPSSLAIIKKMQQSELTESYIYEEIAKFAKGDENKKVLNRLS